MNKTNSTSKHTLMIMYLVIRFKDLQFIQTHTDTIKLSGTQIVTLTQQHDPMYVRTYNLCCLWVSSKHRVVSYHLFQHLWITHHPLHGLLKHWRLGVCMWCVCMCMHACDVCVCVVCAMRVRVWCVCVCVCVCVCACMCVCV